MSPDNWRLARYTVFGVLAAWAASSGLNWLADVLIMLQMQGAA